MKLYIPFNSNDFNNVFSSLSISPRVNYPIRDFGFKKASPSVLNPLEDVLIAFKTPIFPKKRYDIDNGYPLNIAIETNDLSKKAQKSEVLFIMNTVFLFDKFELIYRTEKEKIEVEAKSLKSVETKFAKIAEIQSWVLSEEDNVKWVDSELTPDLFSGYSNNKVQRKDLQPEREINKVFGALIGFAVGSQRNLPSEFKHLQQLSKELKNRVSLFINRIGEPNEIKEKKTVSQILNHIQKEVQLLKPLEQIIVDNTKGQIDSNFFDKLKSLIIFDQSYFDLLLKGMLELKLDDTPLPLKIEKSKRVLYYQINKKYPQKYVERLDKHIKEVLFDIDSMISERIEKTDIDLTSLEVDYDGQKTLNFKACQKYNKKEGEYLYQILNFFIYEDTFTSIDELQESRKEYIGDLGNYLKNNLKDFSTSSEAEYLRDLHKSFGNLTEPFPVENTQLDSLKSIALLFTKGRDFVQYRDLVQNSSIVNTEIGYAIWGSAFGYAGLPKTLTSSIFDQKEKGNDVLNKLSETISMFIDPITDHIASGELQDYSPQINETKVIQRKPEATYEQKAHQSSSKSSDTNYTVLERLLEKVNEIPRASSNQEFKSYIGEVYREIEEESKIGGLFGDPKTRKDAFERKLTNSLGGIKGIGEGTLKKVVDAFDDIIDNLS